MSTADERKRRIKELVEHWFKTDEQLDTVYQFGIPGSDKDALVCLLQITEATPTSPTEVVAYGFAPSEDFEFPLALAQVTPAEWKAIQSKTLPLPKGWEIDQKLKFSRAA